MAGPVKLCICGCGREAYARGMSRTEYERYLRDRPPPRPDPADKVAYLSSLTLRELAAYCAGVLSRASVDPGDKVEVDRWMELVRLTSDRLEGATP